MTANQENSALEMDSVSSFQLCHRGGRFHRRFQKWLFFHLVYTIFNFNGRVPALPLVYNVTGEQGQQFWIQFFNKALPSHAPATPEPTTTGKPTTNATETTTTTTTATTTTVKTTQAPNKRTTVSEPVEIAPSDEPRPVTESSSTAKTISTTDGSVSSPTQTDANMETSESTSGAIFLQFDKQALLIILFVYAALTVVIQ